MEIRSNLVEKKSKLEVVPNRLKNAFEYFKLNIDSYVDRYLWDPKDDLRFQNGIWYIEPKQYTGDSITFGPYFRENFYSPEVDLSQLELMPKIPVVKHDLENKTGTSFTPGTDWKIAIHLADIIDDMWLAKGESFGSREEYIYLLTNKSVPVTILSVPGRNFDLNGKQPTPELVKKLLKISEEEQEWPLKPLLKIENLKPDSEISRRR